MEAARRLVVMIVACVALLASFTHMAAADDVTISYLYKLSNFQGAIPYASPRLFADRARKELYVMGMDGVSIFNAAGMEFFHADYDPEIGSLFDLAVDGEGNIIVLATKGEGPYIMVCNYRFEPLRAIALHNVPPQFGGFRPTDLRYRDGRLYLADSAGMKIVVTDAKGEFLKGYDVFDILKQEFTEEKTDDKGPRGRTDVKREDYGLDGFNLDPEGNMLFVLPVSGKACRLSPDGTAVQFGKRGSGPGKFGVPACIVADDAGDYLVADKLRGVVLVFNKEMKFFTEFSSFGIREAYLAGPSVLAMGADGRLYVGQTSRRGINVYQIRTGS